MSAYAALFITSWIVLCLACAALLDRIAQQRWGRG